VQNAEQTRFSCICYAGTFAGIVLQHELFLGGYKMPYCQQKNIHTFKYNGKRLIDIRDAKGN